MQMADDEDLTAEKATESGGDGEAAEDAESASTPTEVTDSPASPQTPAESEDSGSGSAAGSDGEKGTAPTAEADAAKRGVSHVVLVAILGVVLVLGLGGLTGWLGYQAYQAKKAEEQRNLFVSVARQGAVNLTTINHETAEQDVQRILESATGTFYDDFQARSQPFVQVVKQAQAKSEGSVTEAALESEDGNAGQVLVAVTVKTSNAGAPEQQPRYWRMRLTVEKIGDEAKVSNVEFVP
jgi:Mce-associated membrane protein